MKKFFFVLFLFFVISFFSLLFNQEAPFFFSFSLLYTLTFFFLFINNFNKEVPIFDLICFFAGLQLLLCPSLLDAFDIPTYLRLGVSEKEYFSKIIPTIIAFTVGLFFPFGEKKIILNKIFVQLRMTESVKYWFYLIIIGLFFKILSYFLGSVNTLGPILKISGEVVYIGVIFMFYSEYKYKFLLWFLVMIFTLLTSVSSGLFWGFLFWNMFILMMYVFGRKIFFILKVLIVVVVLIFVVVLQNIKGNFREQISATKDLKVDTKFGIFNELISGTNVSFVDLKNKDTYSKIIIRLNQGRLDSKVLYNIPKYRDYDQGKSIINSLFGAFIPRIFWPDKPGYDTRKLIEFTGYNVGSGTFMSVSPFGEVFANFNLTLSIFFMLAFGLFLNYFHFLLLRKSLQYPSLFLFIPVLFFDVVRVEVDFTHVFSSIVTGLVSMFVIYIIFQKGFGIIIFSEASKTQKN